MRETTEIDIRPGLLHLHHLLDALFHLLHPLFFGIGVEDIFERMVFLLRDDAIAGDGEILVLHQGRDDILLDLLVVLTGIDAIYQLFLQIQHILHHLRVLTGIPDHHGRLIGYLLIAAQGKGPAHQGSLTDILIIGAQIDM